MANLRVAAAVAAAVALALTMVALQERSMHSPSALLERTSALHYPYDYWGYGYGAGRSYDYAGDSYPGYYGSGYGGYYPYSYSSGGYPYGYSGYGYPYGYDDDNAYQAYAAQEHYRSWANYVQDQQDQDAAEEAAYYNYADGYNNYPAYYHAEDQNPGLKMKLPAGLKVANKGTNKLVYTGDLEFGGYKHEITGGNDGGYNAPFDINGDGQEIDNWAKVTTQWKHKKGQGSKAMQLRQLKQARLAQLAGAANSASPSDYVWQKGWG
eukprot:3941564-Rhodomonas_salina.3